MISSKLSFRISLIFGLLILLLTVYSALQPPMVTCGGLARGYLPIIAFELARSVGDLHRIFGDVPSACRTVIAGRMDALNWLDSLVFIPVYGAFLAFYFLGMRVKNLRLATVALAITIVACLADQVENYSLLQLSGDPDHTKWLTLLLVATETKWIGLGIAGTLAAALLWEGGRGLDWLAAALGGTGLVASLISVVAPDVIGPYLSDAIALGWLLVLAIDLRETVRPRLSRAES